MRPWRTVLVVAALVALAVAVQVAFLSRLGLPGSTPDLVVVAVAAVALAYGSTPGAVTGFLAGLLIDLAPPADHAAGQWALVLTLAGYATGVARARGDATMDVRPATVLGIGALSGLATLAALGVGVVVDGWWPGLHDAAIFAGSAVAYAAMLAVLVLPVVQRPLRWAGRDSSHPRSTTVGATRAW